MTHPLPIPDYATPETRAAIESHNAASREIESDLAAVRQRQEAADQADPRTANPGELAAEREAIATARKKLLASKIAMLQERLSILGRLEAERLAGEQAAAPAIGTAREAARTALRAAGYGRYFGDSNPNVKRQAESWVDMAEDVLTASARYERLSRSAWRWWSCARLPRAKSADATNRHKRRLLDWGGAMKKHWHKPRPNLTQFREWLERKRQGKTNNPPATRRELLHPAPSGDGRTLRDET